MLLPQLARLDPCHRQVHFVVVVWESILAAVVEVKLAFQWLAEAVILLALLV